MLAVSAALLALAGCSGNEAPSERPPLEGAAIGGPFTLTAKDGSRVSWSDFAGRWRIVYFGYTFCPDACPTDVQVMIKGFNRFAKDRPELAGKVQPIFITIDPARDTPKAVGEFAAAFSPRLIGLTGSPAEIAATAKAFGIYYAKGAESPGGYLMDHSRTAYLMGPKGEPVALLPIDQGPEAVSKELEKWVR